jgi:hypothetical protein
MAPTAPATTTEGDVEALTFTGEGDPPEDVRALLRPGDLEIKAWGRAAGEPWALVTWDLLEDGNSTLACNDVRPLEGLSNCVPPEGAGRGGVLGFTAFALGKGGLVVVRATLGVDRLSFVSPSGSQIIEIHGEADGYPLTGVLPTSGHAAEGTLIALDANGNSVGEPVSISLAEADFYETPVPA